MLTLTEKAAEKVQYYAGQMPEAEGKSLRVFAQKGGCSGFQYGFTFDDHQEGDTVVESAGVKVLVDKTSAQFLAGATVDYVQDIRGEGFIVDNPNAVGGCNCGESSCCS
jgi:iron-sulfur cluster insertion protein